MKIRLFVLMLSIVAAILFISGGYGSTEKKLIIKGNILVLTPEEFASLTSQDATVMEEVYD